MVAECEAEGTRVSVGIVLRGQVNLEDDTVSGGEVTGRWVSGARRGAFLPGCL